MSVSSKTENPLSFNWRKLVWNFGRDALRKSPLPRTVKLYLLSKAMYLWSWFSPDYSDWIKSCDSFSEEDFKRIRNHILTFSPKPLISVLMPVYNTPETYLRAAIESVINQVYPNWELCISDDASTGISVKKILEEYRKKDSRIKIHYRDSNGHISVNSNSALALATGDYVALFDSDNVLPEYALYFVALEINLYPEARLIYSDHDQITANGKRVRPYFKPDFSIDLLLSQNMINHLGIYDSALLREIGGFRQGYEGAQDWDLALRCVEKIRPDQIRHIPRILYHWRIIPGSTALHIDEKSYAVTRAQKAVQEYLDRHSPGAQASPLGTSSFQRVVYPLPKKPPLVSILIPTTGEFNLLSTCINGLIHKTDYPAMEILVDNNGNNDDPRGLEYIEDLEKRSLVRVIRRRRPENFVFNYSAIMNELAHKATGEILLFLNDDVEPINPDWLREMVSLALRPEIGVVGAKLYYPNDTIQHAGIVLGLGGIARHAFLGFPKDSKGYLDYLFLLREVSAVTFACAAVKKRIFDDLNGLDEKNLSVAYNDVDFCLRAMEHGYRNLWTPHAELYHHESVSRGYDNTVEKRERFKNEGAFMLKKWGNFIKHDPMYNPNLSLIGTGYTIENIPRYTLRPWEAGETF